PDPMMITLRTSSNAPTPLFLKLPFASTDPKPWAFPAPGRPRERARRSGLFGGRGRLPASQRRLAQVLAVERVDDVDADPLGLLVLPGRHDDGLLAVVLALVDGEDVSLGTVGDLGHAVVDRVAAGLAAEGRGGPEEDAESLAEILVAVVVAAVGERVGPGLGLGLLPRRVAGGHRDLRLGSRRPAGAAGGEQARRHRGGAHHRGRR